MKQLYYNFSLVGFLSILLLVNSQSIAGITVSSPSASSSITACGNFTLYYTATSGFSTYVVVEVHQNNSSGATVKTFSNVSSGYLTANQNNTLSSSGLAPGNYQIKVYDYYNPSFNGWSDIFTISPLSPPSSITIVNSQTTPTGFELMWNNPTGTSEYRVDISTTSDFANILPAYNDYHALGSASGGFYVSGLTANQDRFVRIRSYNSCSTSANSATVNVSCFTPATPTATAATNVKTAEFTANWNAVSGADRFYVIVTRTGHETVTSDAIIGSTSFTFTPAHPSSAYSFKVKAATCGVSAESNAITLNTTALAVPNTNTFGGNGDGETWNFHWGAVDGAASYRFQLDTDNTFGSPDLNEIENEPSVEFDVVPCLDYYVRIKSIAGTGEESAYCAAFWLGPTAGCGGRIAADGSKSEPTVNSDASPHETITPFVFFPNPSDSYLTVGLPKNFNAKSLTARTIDATGASIELPFELLEAKAKFDIRGLSPGLYIVTITDGIMKHRSKFVRK
jgi:hypothetical protein